MMINCALYLIWDVDKLLWNTNRLIGTVSLWEPDRWWKMWSASDRSFWSLREGKCFVLVSWMWAEIMLQRAESHQTASSLLSQHVLSCPYLVLLYPQHPFKMMHTLLWGSRRVVLCHRSARQQQNSQKTKQSSAFLLWVDGWRVGEWLPLSA